MKTQLHRQFHDHFQLSTTSTKLRILPPDSYCANNCATNALRKNRNNKMCQLSLLLLASLELIWWQKAVSAQIEPDNTLGAESSIVTPQALRDLIEGGAIRDTNLFHSFAEFNVNEGQNVFFANPEGIVNILTRVTGASPSDIFGTLGVDGAANLILLNPNGINFGANASLDVAGSFLATTAESVIFANSFEFSATNPEAPPLLTVNITPGLQLGNLAPNATITNQGNLSVGKDLTLVAGNLELQGQMQGSENVWLRSLGDINITEAQLRAENGSILLESGNNIQLTNTQVTSAAEIAPGGGITMFAGDAIRLAQQAEINASGLGGGAISLQGNQVFVNDGSQVLSQTIGNEAGEGITMRAADLVAVSGTNSSVQSDTQAVGAGGDVSIETGKLIVSDGAFISASSFGSGAGGNLNVQASESVELRGTGFENLQDIYLRRGLTGQLRLNDRQNGLFTGTAGEGNSGEMRIKTPSLLLQDGGVIFSPTFASGQGGNILVEAAEKVELVGSGMFTVAFANGAAGNIDIETRNLTIQDGGLVITSTLGEGTGGNVNINASESVELLRVPSGATFLLTAIASNSLGIFSGSSGSGGDITIDTGKLIVQDGAAVSTSSGARLRTPSLPVPILAGGKGGNLTITADSVEVTGAFSEGLIDDINSSLVTETLSDADSGDLSISTSKLIVQDNGIVSSSTKTGAGNAGNLTINATEIEVIGASIRSRVESSGSEPTTGDGGDVRIETESLWVMDGGRIDARTSGEGNAGNITIEASESVFLANTGRIISEVREGAEGNPGNINIQAESLSLADRSTISTLIKLGAVANQPGNIEIQTRQLSLTNVSEITASTVGTGDAGNITLLVTDSVSLTGESQIIVSTSGQGNAGNITLLATDSVFLDRSFVNSANSNVNPRAIGDGGQIDIQTQLLSLTNKAQIIANTSGQGDAGDININSNQVTIEDSRILATTFFGGDGGNITITANNLDANSNARINTNTFSSNNAGNITLTVLEDLTLTEGSFFSASASSISTANSGSILIDSSSGNVNIQDGARILVSSEGTGEGGEIEIRAESLALNQSEISAETTSNTGGNITLQVPDLLLLRNGSTISTNAGIAGEGGDGGNMTIDAGIIFAVPSENSDITANAFTGDGGNINITADGILGIEFRAQQTPLSDITASSEFGLDGTVDIDTPDTNPASSVDNLPETPTNPQPIRGCQTTGEEGDTTFVYKGRGGSPSNPFEALSNSDLWEDIQPPNQPVVEAQGWTINDKGNVELVTTNRQFSCDVP